MGAARKVKALCEKFKLDNDATSKLLAVMARREMVWLLLHNSLSKIIYDDAMLVFLHGRRPFSSLSLEYPFDKGRRAGRRVEGLGGWLPSKEANK